MELGEKVVLPIGRSVSPSEKLVVIGTNTGGPLTLTQFLSQLPEDFPAAIIVMQQIRPGFTRVVADILDKACKLPAFEAQDGMQLRRSSILVAPGATSLTIGGDGLARIIRLEQSPGSSGRKHNRTDETMISAANVFGRNAIGILLTGLGEDGRDGMAAIAEAGGSTIAQDEPTSAVHDLPNSAILAGVVKEVLPLWSIADRLVEMVTGGQRNAAAA